jgi:uncharacterized protein (TIGR00725 family)
MSELSPGLPRLSSATYIAVIGSGRSDPSEAEVAEDVGSAIGAAGAVLICGGLGGVMEAACRGAKSAGGLTVGILPGSDRRAANSFIDIAIATGMGEARNTLVAGNADAVVAVGGEFGTLSEIAFALRAGKPVIGLRTWELRRQGSDVEGIVPATDARAAVSLALRLSRSSVT